MPGGGADLGFVAVAVIIAAVIWFSARRRWRMAVARREEVRRLAWLAADEAARAEAEATALAYVAPPLASDAGMENGSDGIRVGDWAMPPAAAAAHGPPQCAVCYRHTTTRCSRCKAVRYCSGRCQIIHWRQGHKDECHPPRNDEHKNGSESASSLKSLQTNQSNISENGVEIETEADTRALETSFRRSSSECSTPSVVYNEDHAEAKPFVDVSGTDFTSDSSAGILSSSSSSSFSTFSGLLETSDDASASDDTHILPYEKIEMSCHDILPEETTPVVHTSKANLKKDPRVSGGSSVNNLSCTHNTEPKVSSCKADDTECRSSGRFESGSFNRLRDSRNHAYTGESKHGHVQAVGGSACGVSSNLLPTNIRSANSSNGIASSEGTVKSSHKFTSSLGKEKSSFIASERISDERLLKSKSGRTPPSFSSMEYDSLNTGTQPVPRDSSSKNENASEHFTGPAEVTGSLPNGINDLKTSVRRVVQQLKSSHLSKHSSGARNDIPRTYKTLFPYELFVKLYNCDKVDLRPCGLTNCGNSCYANAVLQCLAFTRPLTSYLLQGLHTHTCPRIDWCFTCEFENLLVKAKQGISPLSPIGILSHIHNIGSNLGHGREEDAHEFLRYAIDTMQSACLKEAGTYATGTLVEETTLIQLIFGGYLRSKIQCTRCRGKSECRERMMDLTVEIHGDIGTLQEALTRFTATEILDGENKYQCSRCNSYERAKKKLTVLEAPNVLTIALKRFQSGKFGKLNKAVRFPEVLDLAPCMSNTDDKSPVYSLYAVVVHQDIMNAAFSGHYVCYVKSTHGKWYKTDDSRVKPVDIGTVLTKNAYMLFYSRCSPRAPSLIRNAIPHYKTKIKGKDSPFSNNEHDRPPCGLPGHQSISFRPAEVFIERLPFPRTDSSSDSSSLLSYSDEGSCSTESTRDSTSTEELSEYIFGDSGRFSQDSDGFQPSPLVSMHGSDEGLSYGERWGWERGEVGVGVGGRESPGVLYSDTTSQCSRKQQLTGGDCRGREETDNRRVKEGESNVLVRRPSSGRERRASQTFY